MRFCFVAAFAAVFVAPSSLSADGHVEIAVRCAGPVPAAFAVRMMRPDTIIVPIRALEQWCERENGKPA